MCGFPQAGDARGRRDGLDQLWELLSPAPASPWQQLGEQRASVWMHSREMDELLQGSFDSQLLQELQHQRPETPAGPRAAPSPQNHCCSKSAEEKNLLEFQCHIPVMRLLRGWQCCSSGNKQEAPHRNRGTGTQSYVVAHL